MPTRISVTQPMYSDLADKIRGEGLTYDDVLLVPARSSVMPRSVSTQTFLTRRIELNMPLVSAAMDTVTEAEMAIAIAREGGVGVLHKNMSIVQQADEVRRVKRSESGMILDPITLSPGSTVGDARQLMARFSIGGIPVIDEDGRLIGIVTNRDLRFQHDNTVRLSNAMTTTGLITAPIGTTLQTAEALLQEHKIEKLPVVDETGLLRGLITFKDIQKKRQFPNACKDEHGRLRVGAAVGVTPDLLDRVAAIVEAGVDFLTVDTAHGHSEGVLEAVFKVKSDFRTRGSRCGQRCHGRRNRRPYCGRRGCGQGGHRTWFNLHDTCGCRSRGSAAYGHHGLQFGGAGASGSDYRRRWNQTDRRCTEGDCCRRKQRNDRRDVCASGRESR